MAAQAKLRALSRIIILVIPQYPLSTDTAKRIKKHAFPSAVNVALEKLPPFFKGIHGVGEFDGDFGVFDGIR